MALHPRVLAVFDRIKDEGRRAELLKKANDYQTKLDNKTKDRKSKSKPKNPKMDFENAAKTPAKSLQEIVKSSK